MPRTRLDDYPTPAAPLASLRDPLRRIYTGGPILEPSAGAGRLVRFALDELDADDVWACEINGRYRAELAELVGADRLHVGDFLAWDGPEHRRFRLVLGNPPFAEAEAFARRALELVDPCGIVCLLLRLNFLGAQRRREWHRSSGLRYVWTLSARPSFTGNGTDRTEYAWFVWERGHRGPFTGEVL